MTYDEAMALVDEIADFLHECGGPYANGIKAYVTEHLILAVATKQFLYKPGKYFVCWWMLDNSGLKLTKDHIRPDDIVTGTRMYVVECGCQDIEGMKEIRRELRKIGVKEVHWHRANKGWKHFYRQVGGRYGR